MYQNSNSTHWPHCCRQFATSHRKGLPDAPVLDDRQQVRWVGMIDRQPIPAGVSLERIRKLKVGSKMSEPRSPETCYRGDYARVTTPERNITIKLSHEEFAILDARARKENITRAALARNIVLEALGDPVT